MTFVLGRLFCIFLIASGLCVLGIFAIIFLCSLFAISEISNSYNQNLRYKPLSVNIDTTNIPINSTVNSLHAIEQAVAQTILINTGQSVQTSIQSGNVANITGGALGNNTFIYQSFTYYWASNSSSGVTGTTIDGIGFPLEVRVLYINSKYSTISKAVNHQDGLAELVFLFNICSTFNQPFDQLSQYIRNISTTGSSKQVSLGTQFEAVEQLSRNPDTSYYSYQGSFVDSVMGYTYNCSTVIIPKLEAQNSCITADQFSATFGSLKNSFGKPLTNTITHDSSAKQTSLYPQGISTQIHYY